MRLSLILLLIISHGGALATAVEEGGTLATPAKQGKSAKSASSTKQPSTTKVVDYGGAFDRLIQLGLPDTKGASYVKLTIFGAPEQAGMNRTRSGNVGLGGGMKTKGNAWLMPKGTDPKMSEGEKKAENLDSSLRSFVYKGFDSVQVKPKKRRSSLARFLVGEQKPAKDEKGVKFGEWKVVDPATEAQKLLAKMEAQKDGKVFDRDRWEYSDRGARWCGEVLVLACQMYRAGNPKEANQLVSRLFELAPEPILVIDVVVNYLADSQYQMIVDAFFKSKDWNVYHADTKKLVEKFSRGWKSRPGAELLLTHLEQRVKGEKPRLKEWQGVTLNPKAVEILDSWIDQTEPIVVNAPVCWLLGLDLIPSDASEAYSYGLEPVSGEMPEWIKSIAAMGMDGMIALTAAAADESLIPTVMSAGAGGRYGGFSRSYSSFGDGVGRTPAEAKYAAMKRPCSRGEIARKLLLLVVPDPENELVALPPTELQAIAYQWWLKHKNDSRTVLAKEYLQSGSRNQKGLAVMALIQSGVESDAQLVENYILGSDEKVKLFSMVEMYLKMRRSKGKIFFQAYSKALKEEVGEVDEDDFENWEIRQAGGVDKYLAKLEVYVKNISAGKVLAQLKSGEVKPKEGYGLLGVAMKKGDFEKYLPQLVSIARHQKSEELQVEMLDALMSFVYDKRSFPEKKEELDAYYATLLPLLEQSKSDWMYFLSRTEPLKKRGSLGTAPSLAKGASWLVESVYFPADQQSLRQLSQIIPQSELWTFLLERSKKRFSGEKVAPFPSDKNVKPERRVAIRKQLASMDAVSVAKHYDTLTLDEKMAWRQIIIGYGDEVPKGVKGMSQLITKVTNYGDGDIEEFVKKVEALSKYKKVDAEWIDAIQRLMLEDTDTQNETLVSVSLGQSSPLGMQVYMMAGEYGQSSKRSLMRDLSMKGLESGKIEKMSVLKLKGSGLTVDPRILTAPADEKKDPKKSLQVIVDAIAKAKEESQRCSLIFFSATKESYKKFLEKEAEEEDGE